MFWGKIVFQCKSDFIGIWTCYIGSKLANTSRLRHWSAYFVYLCKVILRRCIFLRVFLPARSDFQLFGHNSSQDHPFSNIKNAISSSRPALSNDVWYDTQASLQKNRKPSSFWVHALRRVRFFNFLTGDARFEFLRNSARRLKMRVSA